MQSHISPGGPRSFASQCGAIGIWVGHNPDQSPIIQTDWSGRGGHVCPARPFSRPLGTWLIKICSDGGVEIGVVLEPAAVDLLAVRLRTPLQIEQHLTLALETGLQASETPISEAIGDSVLSKQIDGVEATLNRNGYITKVLTEMLGVKPAALRALFKHEFGSDRARELKEQMLATVLPV